jgi:hypothetical protein
MRAVAVASIAVAAALAAPTVRADDPPAADEPWVYKVPSAEPEPSQEPNEPVSDPSVMTPEEVEARRAARRAEEGSRLANARETARRAGVVLAVLGFSLFSAGYFTGMGAGIASAVRCDESCDGGAEWVWVPILNAFYGLGAVDGDGRFALMGTSFAAQLLGLTLGGAGAWLAANADDFFSSAPTVSIGPGTVVVTVPL